MIFLWCRVFWSLREKNEEMGSEDLMRKLNYKAINSELLLP